MRRGIVLALTCLSPPIAAVAGQDPDPAPAGTRVRVTTTEPRPERVTGTVVEWRGDTLVLAPQDGGGSVRVPTAALAQLEVSRGRRSNAGRGARWGFLGGAVLGTGLGAAFADAQVVSNGAIVALAAGFGGLTGMLLGAGIGAGIHSERWEDVPAKDVSASLMPSRNGLTFGVAIAF